MSPDAVEQPYGEWPSPITAEAVVAASVSLTGLQRVGDDVFWSELRPEEAGRVQIVRRTPDGATTDLLPDGVSARTRVHEYGGQCWVVDGSRLVYNDWADQRLYRLDLDVDGAVPQAITPAPGSQHGFRHADLDVVGDWVVCVRERHDAGDGPDDHAEAVNDIVGVHLLGDRPVRTLVSGADFVASPRVSAGGDRLAWFQWSHPDMPWDSTEAYVATLDVDDDSIVAGGAGPVAGGTGVSVQDPRWHGDDLHVVSDRSGWWNVYLGDDNRTPVDAEVGLPHWVFGRTRYGWLDDGRLVFAALADSRSGLFVRADDGTITSIDQPYTEIESIAVAGDDIVLIGGSATSEPVIARVGLDGTVDELRPARTLPFGAEYLSVPEPISFPSGERTAHGLHYPPTNPDVVAPAGDTPPLLVMIHGGPTAAARAQLSLATQYWTSRGFAVVDVNYGGSTGFGRPYRRLLDASWGIVDVEDCIAAARHLADQGLADPERLCIQGGSAGGFTVLACLVAGDTFAVGASSYGVADLTALAEETHKFESRYLDSLVGPYPDAADVYASRSPINHVDAIDRPLIVFQGLEDEIVPPNQSEMIVAALEAKGIAVEYHAFEGEQHGFRKAENVITVLESKLAFFGKVLGFTPA